MLFGLYNMAATFQSVGPKPFAVAQRMFSILSKASVQTTYIESIQIGGLCWYPSEGTLGWLEITLPLLFGFYLGYICYLWVAMGLWVIICGVYKFVDIDNNKVQVKIQKVSSICIDSLSICYICISNLDLTSGFGSKTSIFLCLTLIDQMYSNKCRTIDAIIENAELVIYLA